MREKVGGMRTYQPKYKYNRFALYVSLVRLQEEESANDEEGEDC